MSHVARDIRDRVAIGDDIFLLENLGTGRYRLIPSPDSVVEAGTPINKALLQPIEDMFVKLANAFLNDITSNPFDVRFDYNLEGVTVTGVWDTDRGVISC